MRGDADTLTSPVRLGVRRLALALLDELTRTADRFDDPADAEALHDLRVVVRRLRGLARAFRGPLRGALPRRLSRRLRDLGRATAEARDAEVHVEWLGRAPFAAHAADLLPALAARREGAYREARSAIPRRARRLARRLTERVERVDLRVCVRSGRGRTSLASASARRLRDAASRLARRLSVVESAQHEAEAHAARIAAKRLRYLLEPFEAAVEGAQSVVAELKALQQTLGDLNDLHGLRAAIGEAEGATPALKRRVSAEIRKQFNGLRESWLNGAGGAFFERVEHTAEAMAALDHEGLENERKYLLRGVPDAARGAPSREIEQGYLPGEKLHERVRRERDADGVRHWRTVKAGRGVTRVEIEEATPAELFEALYALTAGRRVHKRRYCVTDGERTWEIDEFLDRDLCLAEIELADADEGVDLPPWLAPAVEREVTDDPRYLNLNLAR